MNTKFYKEFQDKYPTILGSDRNISYTQFLEEMVTELQQINQNDLSGDVSNNEVFSEVAVCDCKAPAFRDEHGNHRCTECNELCNTD
jgi:hypothetical protein